MVQNVAARAPAFNTHIPGNRIEEEPKEGTPSPFKKMSQKYHTMLLLIVQWPKCYIPLLATKKLRNVVLINRHYLEHCSAKDPEDSPCLSLW